eukprot:14064085-Alexandrium_andersonii.AAC.1
MQQQPSSRSNTIRCTNMHHAVICSPKATGKRDEGTWACMPIQQPLGRSKPRAKCKQAEKE